MPDKITLLSAPNLNGNEWKYIKDCLDTGWVSSVGSYVTKFEQMVADFSGAKYGVACVNGTAALHISLKLSGVTDGDYVIVPNITFIASANSVDYCGAEPIFMDIDPLTWQIDLDLLEAFLSTKTVSKNEGCVLAKNNRVIRAIMPVHVLGSMCDMNRLTDIALKYGLAVVEDATEALGSYYNGQHAGSFAKFGCFSFNGNKIITTGGGGVIVTNDKELAAKARHLTTQAKSDSFEYIHDEIGYNYRLVNVLAAMGVAQMEQLPIFIQRKKEINAYYRARLSADPDIWFQKVEDGVDSNCWLFTFSHPKQRELLQGLNDCGFQSRPFWRPMNQLPMFKEKMYITDVDNSNKVYSTCLSIPCSTFLTNTDIAAVADCIENVLTKS